VIRNVGGGRGPGLEHEYEVGAVAWLVILVVGLEATFLVVYLDWIGLDDVLSEEKVTFLEVFDDASSGRLRLLEIEIRHNVEEKAHYRMGLEAAARLSIGQ